MPEDALPLITQQDVIVITSPYNVPKGGRIEDAAAEKLRATLEAYPPCRIVSIAGGGTLHAYTLTAVIETV